MLPCYVRSEVKSTVKKMPVPLPNVSYFIPKMKWLCTLKSTDDMSVYSQPKQVATDMTEAKDVAQYRPTIQRSALEYPPPPYGMGNFLARLDPATNQFTFFL